MEDKTWGMRFNPHPDYQRLHKGQKPEGCPDWFETRQIDIWQEQGLVLWNNVDKRIGVLGGGEALKLLSELHSQENWKSQDISVTRLVRKIDLQQPSRGRRKKMEQEPKVDPGITEAVYEEILRLPPEAGPELMELLKQKKLILADMAAREKEQSIEAAILFWEFALESFHQKEQNDVDFPSRSLAWQSDGQFQWVCQRQSVEGRVGLGKSKGLWHARVTKPRHNGKSQFFGSLLDAVEWTEKEMLELADQPDTPEPPPFFRMKE